MCVYMYPFTDKLKLAMKGDELELWTASLTTLSQYIVTVER